MAIKIASGFLLLLLLSYLVGFFLPQTYEVSRSVVIAAPRAEIHAALENVSTWKEWSAFVPSGESAQMVTSKYEGPEAGVGAIWIWGQDLEKSPARLEVVTSDANWGISYVLTLDKGRIASEGDILMVEDENGIQVTFENRGEMATPWRRYFSFIADKAVGPALAQSLDGLKARLEGTAAVQEPTPSETQESETPAPDAQPVGAGQ
ncbi:MAG: SRPBCC family protein [Planctomycetes bacterium]|nr:SRPBCC family protein [Planctomycetota bacterium]